MATEKDRAVTEARKELRRLFGVGGIGQGMLQEILNNLWEAARADAIEECAKIAEAYGKAQPNTATGYHVTVVTSEIATYLRSLSRKQEEPR